MQKRHFELLAKTLKSVRPEYEYYESMALGTNLQWDATVAAIATVLATTNNKFDRERFILACGGLLQE